MLGRLTLVFALVLGLAATALAEGPVGGMLYHKFKSIQMTGSDRFVTITEVQSAPGQAIEYVQVWSIKADGTLLLQDSVDLTTPVTRTDRIQVTHQNKMEISPEK